MTPIAPPLPACFQERLPRARRARPHTSESSAYAFTRLWAYASARLKVPPSHLALEPLDAPWVGSCLPHLETARANRPSSRHARLAAITSCLPFREYRGPAALEPMRRILAIPRKQAEARRVRPLTGEELPAPRDAPAPTGWSGIRDRAMLPLGFAGGLRVSELVGLRLADAALHPQASLLVPGQGRRERCRPLGQVTAAALRAGLAGRGPGRGPELFLNARGHPLTRSGFESILATHVRTAATSCPALATQRVSPHGLRHTCALTVLQATKDLRKVALWLGPAHRPTTEMTTRADPSVKLEALEAMVAPQLRAGRFKATDTLIAALASRAVMRSPTPAS